MITPGYNSLAQPSAIQPSRFKPSTFGLQASYEWAPGQQDSQELLDAMACAEGSWRVTIVGDIEVSATWGSFGTRRIATMDAPVVAIFGGQVSLQGRARTNEGAKAVVTLAPATSGFETNFRRLVNSVGGAIPLEPEWFQYQALTASVVTIRGTAVNVPALSKVPLVSGSVLTSGIGYLEFTP